MPAITIPNRDNLAPLIGVVLLTALAWWGFTGLSSQEAVSPPHSAGDVAGSNEVWSVRSGQFCPVTVDPESTSPDGVIDGYGNFVVRAEKPVVVDHNNPPTGLMVYSIKQRSRIPLFDENSAEWSEPAGRYVPRAERTTNDITAYAYDEVSDCLVFRKEQSFWPSNENPATAGRDFQVRDVWSIADAHYCPLKIDEGHSGPDGTIDSEGCFVSRLQRPLPLSRSDSFVPMIYSIKQRDRIPLYEKGGAEWSEPEGRYVPIGQRQITDLTAYCYDAVHDCFVFYKQQPYWP